MSDQRRVSTATLVLIASLGGVECATAAEISRATFANGKLIVRGTSALGSFVTLDGTFTAPIAAGRFEFEILYHPADCIVRVKSNEVSDPAVEAVVALCGEAGINPKGRWKPTETYQPRDVVRHEGSSWRAVRTIAAGVEPGTNRSWDLFVAQGDRGPRGIQGATGPQ